MQWKRIFFGLMLALGFSIVFNLSSIPSAEAACGASVSSCKSCHEVKKEMPVANSGIWHSDHSFGDFCEYCHGGVVSSQDKQEAHTGLVKPFADVQASCSACHVEDLKDRAATYDVTLTAGGSSDGGSGTGSGGSGGVAAPEVVPAEQVPEKDLVDYNLKLAQARGETGGINAGNIILILLNLGALAALGYFLWKYDLRKLALSSREIAAAKEIDEKIERLAALDLPEEQLAALGKLVEHPQGAKLVKRLAETDFEKIKEAASLPQEAVALAKMLEEEEGTA